MTQRTSQLWAARCHGVSQSRASSSLCLRPMMVSSSPMVKSHLFAEHTGLLFPSRLLCKAPDWHEQPAAHCPAGILNSQAQTRTSGLPTPRPLPLPRPPLSRDFRTALAPFAQALAWPRTLSAPHRPSAAMVPTITPRPESASRSVLPAHSLSSRPLTPGSAFPWRAGCQRKHRVDFFS